MNIKIYNENLEVIPTTREQVTTYNKETRKREFSREKFLKNAEINRNNYINSRIKKEIKFK